ncbi:MAG: hypothetical protein FJ150_05250 [Euryarchaeota archaeon]|nr:hypothetical protein [Euryarchaeota archaeon]
MKVLLSIKPKYVEEIINGNKKYEFRKTSFRRKDELEEIFIYSTSPVKKIVGYFKFKKIIEDHPKNLWKNFKEFSGIDEFEFFNYFKGKDNGFAIEIKELKLFNKPIDPGVLIPNFIPPQSFRYIEKNWTELDKEEKEENRLNLFIN